MTIDTITNPLINFSVRVIAHKFYQSSQLNNIPCVVVDIGYKMVKRDHVHNLAELELQQINENLGAIRKTKGAQCKFCAILVCIFFFVHNEFPSFGRVDWKTNRSVIVQINDYIEQLGDNFESIMTSYFEYFKKTMKGRMRIPISLVEKYVHDICFLVDIDFTYI